MQWVNEGVVAVNSYSFVNYRKELQDASQYFTPEGWQQYQQSLRDARNLETVIAKKMVVTAAATGAPQITDQGTLNGRYAWKVKIPMLLTYENQDERIQQPVTVNVLVSASPIWTRLKASELPNITPLNVR